VGGFSLPLALADLNDNKNKGLLWTSRREYAFIVDPPELTVAAAFRRPPCGLGLPLFLARNGRRSLTIAPYEDAEAIYSSLPAQDMLYIVRNDRSALLEPDNDRWLLNILFPWFIPPSRTVQL
jgi:hypothetical protein